MKNKMVWLTDTHLNFCHIEKIRAFCNHIVEEQPSCVVLTGDISEATTLELHLRLMEMLIGNEIPLYFICGNHDYYHGSIKAVREILKNKFNVGSKCFWLPNTDFISLTNDVALVGHDGWYDGRYCDYFASNLDMADYHLIEELKGGQYKIVDRYETIGKLAQEAAYHVSNGIKKAFNSNHSIVYVATHVSPFMECSRAPDGSMSDKHWMPHFSSKYMGDAILDTMAMFPKEMQCIILSGHNHTYYEFEPTNNILCISGGAKYKYPKIVKTFEY